MKYEDMTEDQLKNQIRILEAQDIWRLIEAHKALDRCTKTNYLASGLTITIKNINKTKTTVAEEFMISNGFSDTLIEALKNDIKQSYDDKKNIIPDL